MSMFRTSLMMNLMRIIVCRLIKTKEGAALAIAMPSSIRVNKTSIPLSKQGKSLNTQNPLNTLPKLYRAKWNPKLNITIDITTLAREEEKEPNRKKRTNGWMQLMGIRKCCQMRCLLVKQGGPEMMWLRGAFQVVPGVITIGQEELPMVLLFMLLS